MQVIFEKRKHEINESEELEKKRSQEKKITPEKKFLRKGGKYPFSVRKNT